LINRDDSDELITVIRINLHKINYSQYDKALPDVVRLSVIVYIIKYYYLG